MGEVSAHAILPASSSKRWMACTPSARFEQQFPNTETVFAAEGTLAHEICEHILKERLGIKPKSGWLDVVKVNSLWSPEMLTYCEQYADFCMDTVSPDSIAAVETRLDTSEFIPEGFGTGDFMVYTPSLRLLDFTDLKYGKGVPVYATDNPQLKIYALGAYAWFRWVYGEDLAIDTIRVCIYQPRLNNISKWEISLSDLMAWAHTELAPKAKMAFAGEGEFAVGEHCKFCRARVRCEALAEHNLDLFKHELAAHDQLKDDDLVEIVKKVPLLISWANDIAEYMLAEATKGKEWRGMKLVEGKSNRVYVSEAETEKKLLGAGHKDIYTPAALLGVTKLKAALGAKVFKELVEPDLRKPPGKPTLVDAADPRPEFDRAQAVFKDIEIREEITE